MNRRSFLLLLLKSSVGLCASYYAVTTSPSFFQKESDIRRWFKSSLNAFNAIATIAPRKGYSSFKMHADKRSFCETLTAQIKEDFRINRTVIVDGWVLSKTEVEFCQWVSNT